MAQERQVQALSIANKESPQQIGGYGTLYDSVKYGGRFFIVSVKSVNFTFSVSYLLGDDCRL